MTTHDVGSRGTAAATLAPRERRPFGPGVPSGLVQICSILLIAAGLFMLFHRLGLNGLTFDEDADKQIAESFIDNPHNLRWNLEEPSQARLPMIVAAVTMAALGRSITVFKLPFAVMGLAGGIVLFWGLARWFGATTAMLLTAYYFCSPYVLGASRMAATAGDAAAMALWIAYLFAMVRWIEGKAFWPDGVTAGVLAGLAVGAKLTSVVLLGLPLLHLTYWPGVPVRSRIVRLLAPGAAYLALAIAVAMVANPLLTHGPRFLLRAVAGQMEWAQPGTQFLILGSWSPRAPWYYLPALLISKYTIPFLALAIASMVLWSRDALRARVATPLLTVHLGALLLTSVFLARPLQNAHFYIVTVGPMIVLSGFLVHRLLDDRRTAQSRRLWGALLTAIVVFTAIRSWLLSPDFIQAGREFGPSFQGEFYGPAVNHCQGGPLLIEKMNELQRVADGPVYVLENCLNLIRTASLLGPVAAQFPLEAWDGTRPDRPYYLVKSRVFDVFELAPEKLLAKQQWGRKAVAGCEQVPWERDVFAIYRCPAQQASGSGNPRVLGRSPQ